MDQNLIDLYNLLSSVFSTGMTMDFAGAANDVPTGWLLLDGKTVGSGSSGADYASSDAEALFKLMWNNTLNSEYQLLNSSGSFIPRSATAQEDWDNSSRIPLPDVRGKTTVGSGSTTDTDKAGNTIKGRTHLDTFGLQLIDLTHSHSLTSVTLSTKSFGSISTSSNGGHTPSGSVNVQSGGSHTHSVTGTTTDNGGHTPSGSVNIDNAKAYPDGSSPIKDHITEQIPEATSETTVTVVTDPTHIIKSGTDNPAHNHDAGFEGEAIPDHNHDINTTTSSNGSHSHTATFSGNSVPDHSHDVNIPDHTHSISGGTDQGLATYDPTQPSIAMYKIIKL
jgi:hypothetical protein